MLVVWNKEDDEATRTSPKLGTSPLSSVMGSNEKSTGEITAGQPPSIDSRLTPKINHPDVQAKATTWSSSQGQDSAHSARTKIFNVRLRSSKHPRYVDVKTRLIALWHQSLRHEKSRGGTLLSKSSSGEGRKSVTPPRLAIDTSGTANPIANLRWWLSHSVVLLKQPRLVNHRIIVPLALGLPFSLPV